MPSADSTCAATTIVNVGVHALTALLVFFVLRRTFARGAAPQIASADVLALACALIWSVHTLNSEVVNYLAERTESLMALFYLLGLSCAIAALDSRRVLRWDCVRSAQPSARSTRRNQR
jgi:hypothetical protein